MNRSKKKSFDWYGARQRFSIRKYHIGAASVLLGTTLVLGTGTIVSAETGVNGDGASNEQIVPGNGTGTSDGTQPQGDNQGNNSSGVQTGNTTNSTANVQPADDTGSASSQPVGTSRSANTGTQGDGSTNQPVDEPVIKFPTTVNDPVPEGYVLVAFIKPESGAKYVFEGLQGEFPNAPAQLIERRKLQLEVRFWVKEGTTWGQLFETPEWRWPKINPVSGDVFIDWNYGYGNRNRFDSNKMKDQLVTTSYFIPMLNYEVEEIEPSNASVEAFLAWYSPEGRSKWFIVSFDAGQGSMTYESKQYTSRSVAVYYQNIGYDNNQFTSKVVSPTLDGHTFVRWQTEDGKVLPTTGTITSTEVYKALYLAHPQNKVAVFDSTKLTDSEKEQVKKNILDANPDLSTGVAPAIKAIDISDTGEATVTFDDKVVTVPSTTLTNEDKDAAKSNAKAEIEKDAMEKSAAINDSALTNEEKAAKLADVQDAKDRADIAIDKATTTEDLTKALEDGKTKINAINTTTSPKKAVAKQDLETAYNAKKDAITNSGLTAEEKATKLAELDKAKEDATKSIDTATTDDSVHKALTEGKSTIAAIDTTASPKKTAAKQDLETAYNAKKVEIENSALTAEEKAAKQAELDQVKSAADRTIAAATDNAGVAKALEDGKSAIDAINTTTSAKKAQAKQDLETAYNAKKAEIANSGLTAEEKATKLAELDKAKEDATKSIDTATTDDSVHKALTEGKSTIAAIDTTASPKKTAAKQDLETAYNAKKSEIENSALTAEEKAAKQAELDKAKADADKAIDVATDASGVAKALEAGKATIDAINTTTSAEKAAAKQTLEDAYNAKKNAITNSGLTAEEKDAKQAELDKAKADADKAIDTATDNAGVDAALEAGKTAIAGIDTSTSPKKDQAKEELKAAAEDAKKAIDANDNLTDAEKQAAKDAVDAEVAKAEKAIDAATKADEVDAATLAGTAAIAADVLDAAKQDAKNKIAKDVEAANAAIESNPNLSEDEKKGFKDAVDAEAVKANGEIDKATTPEAAQAAEEAGTAAIAEDVLDAAKQDAKNKIAKDLATVEAAIDANSNLSQDEKDAAKLAAQAKEAEAVANIEKATTPEAAQTLEDAAVKDLANIEIKAAYDDAVKAIEAADNLSTAAKTKALDDLKKARQAAEEAVKNATTADEVAKGALDGLKSIAKIEATAAADDAKEAIAKNSNLTDAEKKVYTDAIDKALKDTETKIDAATDADTVDAETVLAQKDIAKQEVAAATADAVKGIEANTNLTPEEKAEYKANVAKAAADAEKAITEATKAADIQSKTFDATQAAAKEEVKADAADAIAGIKANDNLSDTAKEEAIAAIEEARDTTLENIENAKTAADVDAATLDAEKANAKAEIKAAADDAKKAIDENANLPASDKNALKLAIDAEVAATNLEIDNAKTAEEIDAATLATEKSIAKAEVKAAAEDALQAIDENANLTDAEKAKAKADVYVELSKAEKAIDKATTADAIDNATLVGEKAFATAELEAA
ncbi:DUF1542 domain-containing protein, partial [Streptococcus suis]|nr:DUF1542 domain-containing protein [Streptococcus suis]